MSDINTAAAPADNATVAQQGSSAMAFTLDSLPAIKSILNLPESEARKRIDAFADDDALAIVALLSQPGSKEALTSKLADGIYKHLVSTVNVKVQLLCSELNDVDRWQKDILDNTGIYIQRAPMGAFGLEAGLMHHSDKDGVNAMTRGGIGAYVRLASHNPPSVSATRKAEREALVKSALA